MTTKTAELARECQRLSESCLYTSTSLFVWLRFRRLVRGVFIVVPLALGTLTSWKLLTELDLQSIKVALGVAALLAGLMPSIYAALKLDEGTEDCKRAAGAFKDLQDRFRQLALISSRKPFVEFQQEFGECRRKLEEARKDALTPPEWCFRRAQAKVKKGDYTFDVDIEGLQQQAEEKQP